MGCCEHAGFQQPMRVVEGHADLHRPAVGIEDIVDLVHTPDELPALVSNGGYDDGVACMDLTDVALIDIGDDPYPPQVGNLKGGLIVRILAHITVVKDVCRGDISRYRCFQKGIGSASQAFDMGDGGELSKDNQGGHYNVWED